MLKEDFFTYFVVQPQKHEFFLTFSIPTSFLRFSKFYIPFVCAQIFELLFTDQKQSLILRPRGLFLFLIDHISVASFLLLYKKGGSIELFFMVVSVFILSTVFLSSISQ